jgi:deoxyribose-phosphate aldolase
MAHHITTLAPAGGGGAPPLSPICRERFVASVPMLAAMPEAIEKSIEHTLLRATATPGEVAVLCREAREHGFHGVCVNPILVSLAARELADSSCCVVTVVAFPLGASVPAVAAAAARQAVVDGAAEIDMVIPIGLALVGDDAAVSRSVATVREAIPDHTLKVILETGHFPPERIRELGRLALAAGADFLKTSTGFGPRGASVEDVKLLVEAGAGRAGVKAAGGIRTAPAARAMLAAGATRIGTSAGVAIVTAPSGSSSP